MQGAADTNTANSAQGADQENLHKQLEIAEKQVAILSHLEADNRHVHRSLLEQKSRYQKLQTILFVVSIPWLILLAPLTILWAIIYFVKRSKKSKSGLFSAPKGHSDDPRFNNRHVFQALLRLQAFGVDEGVLALGEDSHSTPKGAKALFEATALQDDGAWEAATNRWLAHYSKCRVKVLAGDAPRFKRVRFEDIPAIQNGHKISVIMPAFNAERWIELAVRSVLNQSWHNLELIVVNDNSTDATAEILNRLAKTDERLLVLHNPVNVGPYVSKNAGLSFATGDFITGHDADDIALPDRLALQVEHLLQDPKLQGVIGQMIRVDETASLCIASKVGASSFDGIHRTAMISLMARRTVFEKFGYWDSVRFDADTEYRTRLNAHFGAQIKTTSDLTMICLSAPESLTNNPQHGAGGLSGVSPVRIEYRKKWRVWHKAHEGIVLHRDFSNAERPFDAPSEMLVPQKDIESLQAHYASIRAKM